MDKKQREQLKDVIQKRALIWGSSEPLIDNHGHSSRFLFDFRPLLQDPVFLSSITDIFWARYGHYKKIQIATLELGCVTLLGALLLKAKALKIEANGLVIRKSRKKTGRQRIIEGEITDSPVIVIDDILNSGSSFLKVQKVLADEGLGIREYFALLSFDAPEVKNNLTKNNLHGMALFFLHEFGIRLDPMADPANLRQFEDVFSFTPDLLPIKRHEIFPQSTPVLDETASRIFYGTSDGDVLCLDAKNGKELWRHSTQTVDPKGIASSPAYHKGVVYCAAYNGKIFALNAKSGKVIWERRCADWIGSSPILSLKEKSLFVGLEHARKKKRGGLICLDMKSGEPKWNLENDEFIHGTPAYSEKHNMVAVGTNDGYLLMVDAGNGRVRWAFKTLGPMKSIPTFFDDDRMIAVAAHDAGVYCLQVKDGQLLQFFRTEAINYTQPLFYKGHLYTTSNDGCLYRLDLQSRKAIQELATPGRIFSSPALINGKIFFGNNGGQVFEYDPQERRLIGEHIVADRVLSSIVYSKKRNLYYFHSSDDRLFAFSDRKSTKATPLKLTKHKGSARGFESLISKEFQQSHSSVTRINKDGSLTVFNSKDRDHDLILEGLAADVWKLLEQKRSMPELQALVALWHKLNKSQAQRCLKPILKQFFIEGIIEDSRSKRE